MLTVENTDGLMVGSCASCAALKWLGERGNERWGELLACVGLGLAIVKSITHAHDGTLTLTPRDEGGLRVTVQLPAAPSA